MEEHPFVSINEAKAMFGPADGPGANLTNWGENCCMQNIHVHHPKTYEEVAGLVKALAAQGAKLRVLGVMHSWSNVFADDGTHVIFLDNFKTIAQAPNDYTLVTLQVRCSLGFTFPFCPRFSVFSFDISSFPSAHVISTFPSLLPPSLSSSLPGGRDERGVG
jgi:hypothetical protein